jgi:hypothetical protein
MVILIFFNKNLKQFPDHFETIFGLCQALEDFMVLECALTGSLESIIFPEL